MANIRVHEPPTVARLRECFTYDPETGLLLWAIQAGRASVGYPAGNIKSLGYLGVQLDKVPLLVHRIVWAMEHGEWPENQIDHIDGCRSNNKLENLRPASHSQNMRNKVGWGKSGVKGVCWIEGDKKWRASLGVGKSVRYLGQFETIEEADMAYRLAAQAQQGDFAYHNTATNRKQPRYPSKGALK